ncbi:stromelysin-2-like isoform X2 [Phyllobates terribilis]|uniref:stromelysin-2-like isoform X2 n=1 Tax=Phyllobates terribilis TaxID=111132 RepID=UPI003CCAF8C3
MMQVHCVVLLSLCCCALAMPRPQYNSGISSSEQNLAEEYLNKFYSFTATENNSFIKRLEAMQRFLRIKLTGMLDPHTINMMKAPRCGVPDVTELSTRSERPKWQKNSITYRIENYTPDLPTSVVDDLIKKAFSVWSQVTPLRFIKVNKEEADILIQFSAGAHGDWSPFDGTGREFAHAFAPGPEIGGDVHFDEDERWTNNQEGSEENGGGWLGKTMFGSFLTRKKTSICFWWLHMSLGIPWDSITQKIRRP